MGVGLTACTTAPQSVSDQHSDPLIRATAHCRYEARATAGSPVIMTGTTFALSPRGMDPVSLGLSLNEAEYQRVLGDCMLRRGYQ